MIYTKKKNTKKAYKKKASKKLSIAPAIQNSIKSYVKSTLHRAAETKMASVTLTMTGFNSSIGSSDLARLLPVIQQGVAQNTRIGSEIKPVKLVVRGYCVYHSDSYYPAVMLGVRIFMYQNKSVRSYATPLSSVNVNLLDNGGDGTTFNGTVANWLSPHNTDQFNFYKDSKYKVFKSYGLTDTSVAVNSLTEINGSLFHSFTHTIYPGKNGFPTTLKYDNASGSNEYPTNFAPYWSLGYANLLNYGPDALDTQINASFVSTLYYEDE